MDVKSTFLNRELEEQVYIEGFLLFEKTRLFLQVKEGFVWSQAHS